MNSENWFEKQFNKIKQKKISKQEEKIRQMAYLLWEAAGKPEGKDIYFWNRAKRRLYPSGFRIFIYLSISAILAYFIFLIPPIDLKDEYRLMARERTEEKTEKRTEEKTEEKTVQKESKYFLKLWTENSSDKSKSFRRRFEFQLILRELDKSINEIRTRQEHESAWYKVKFLFIGTISITFITLIYKEGQKESNQKDLKNVLKKSSIFLGLGLSVIVSVIIDMHLRAIHKINYINGIWIANFVEPLFFSAHGQIEGFEYKKIYKKTKYKDKNRKDEIQIETSKCKINISSDSFNRQFYLWEEFIRAGEKSYFTDSIHMLTFWQHIFLVTILTYLAFVFSLIYSLKLGVNLDSKKTQKFIFIVVHLIIIFCATTTHIVPGMFEVKVFGLIKVEDNYLIPVSYFLLSLILSKVSWCIVFDTR